MKARLIIDKNPQDAASNMAIDLTILSSYKVPTLRIYSWKPWAVSIGRFQSLKDEVDTDFCNSIGVDYVRRITGGGAVFHQKELTYSFTISEKNDLFSSDLTESYKSICGAVIRGLKKINIMAEFKPINDLVTHGKKISGCAQTRKKGVILQHGTLLLDLDVVTMFRILKVPKEKISDKQISDVKERVTSIKDELGKELPKKDVENVIILGFADEFDLLFTNTNLNEKEEKLAEKYKREIFLNPSWTYER